MVCVFNACGWDRFDRRDNTPEDGAVVRVCTPHGCPPPNAMGHCFVETLQGKFIGLVSTASLARYSPRASTEGKMMREVLAYDLELYAINTGQLYQTHKSLARRKQNAWAWIMHVRDNVIPRYSREIEPVWASAETVDAVAVALMEYYARHVMESV